LHILNFLIYLIILSIPNFTLSIIDIFEDALMLVYHSLVCVSKALDVIKY